MSRRGRSRAQARVHQVRGVRAEMLEARRLLASIAGTVFYDVDADGVIDAGEDGLSGWMVYHDANLNGVRDIDAHVSFNSPNVPRSFGASPSTNTSGNTVSGLSGVIADVNVTLDITHSWVGDVIVSLVSPTGQEVFLVNQTGGVNNDGDDYSNTTFDDEAASSITSGSPPYSGTFRPVGTLANFDGFSPNGTWTLKLEDDFPPEDDGVLNSWSISIATAETNVTTDSNGAYSFSELEAGTYRIRTEVQSPYFPTSPPDGFHDVTVTAAQNVTGRNFGNGLPPGEIRGAKWNDKDGDGVKDAGEPGLVGVTVYVDLDEDGVLDAGEPSAVTAGDGTYAITGVPPGTRVVREIVPSGYVQTFPTPFGAAAATTFRSGALAIMGPEPAAREPSTFSGSNQKYRPIWAPGTSRDVVDAFYAQSRSEAKLSEFTFSDGDRWSRTATNGSGLVQGQATTLTWNVVADGTPIPGFDGEPSAPSELRAFLNGIYGSETVWMALFHQVFDAWSGLTGITYVYENADDGSSFSDFNLSSTRGVLGVRADIRIGGHPIDGDLGVLAYNFFPNVGEMVIDTSDIFYLLVAGNGDLGLRNVLAHEHGHGIGLGHVMPVNETKLMEPFLSFEFDGPQHDDILAANRGYGDRLEKSGGNDSIGTATNLGSLANGAITTTNVSIDDDSDFDFFRFTVGSGKRATITLSPVGSTYLSGTQFGPPPTNFNSLAQSDLALQLIAPDGVTVLATANLNGAGFSEKLANIPLNAGGQHYLRITGNANAAQLYNLDITIADALSGAHSVTVVSEQIVNGINFGNFPVVFTGSGGNDEYTVDVAPIDEMLHIAQSLSGGAVENFAVPLALIDGVAVTFNGGQGDDLFDVTFDIGSYNVSLVIDGQGNDDALAVHTNQVIDATATTVTDVPAQSTTVIYSGIETLTLDSNGGAISEDLDGLNLRTNMNHGSFQVSQRLKQLSVLGSVLFAGPYLGFGDDVVVVCTGLEVQAGQLAITGQSAVIIDYDGASPIGAWNGSAYTGILGMAQAKKIATDDPVENVAVVEASAALRLTGTQTALWRGQTVDATSLLLAHTLEGDTNLSGNIDADDYFQIDSNYGRSGAGHLSYFNGDVDYDGDIDGDDYFIIDQSFSAQFAPIVPAATAMAVYRGDDHDTESAGHPPKSQTAYRRLVEEEPESQSLLE